MKHVRDTGDHLDMLLPVYHSAALFLLPDAWASETAIDPCG